MLQAGDKIIRQMDGFRQGSFWENDGEVVSVNLKDGVIKASVFVDQPRTMVFDLFTGVNVNGAEYGWIKGYKKEDKS